MSLIGFALSTDGSKVSKAKSAKGRAVGDGEKDKAVLKKDVRESPQAGGGAGFHSLHMFSHLPPHLKMTAERAVKKSDVRRMHHP